jgi:hypothetical protein
MQLELISDVLRPGDRVIELPGTASQRIGTLLYFAYERRHFDGVRYPVVLWDSGVRSYSSADLGLCKLPDRAELQISLFE